MHLGLRDFELSPLNSRGFAIDAHDGVVVDCPQRSKVAIVGAGLYRDQAPVDDPEWAVWGCNVVPVWDARRRLRCDRWFDIHEMHAQSYEDLAWFQRCPVPLYLAPRAIDGMTPDGLIPVRWDAAGAPTAFRAIPHAVRYPVERVERVCGRGYWSVTFAYQTALALVEGATDIGYWGVELSHGTERERTVEWACLSYWIGYARARGVRVHVPEQSMLGQSRHRYGMEYDAEVEAVKAYVRETTQHGQLRQALDKPHLRHRPLVRDIVAALDALDSRESQGG